MKKKQTQKAATGLQRIQVKQQAQGNVAATAGGAAGEFLGNMLLPGIGGQIGSTLGSLGGQALYNQAIKLTDEDQQLKDAEAAQKRAAQQAITWGNVSMDTGSQSQGSQYKQGVKKVSHKPIEIEGGEPHFSKKVNGKRQLKAYHPNGPSHEQGGIDVLAAAGDAIVTKKAGMGKKAVDAHARGDHKTVEKIISKMPEDKKAKQKAAGGIKDIRFNSTIGLDSPLFETASPSDSLASRFNAIGEGYLRAPASAPIPATSPPTNWGAIGSQVAGNLNGLAQVAPSLFNLGQGLFGDVVETKRRNFTPSLLSYEDGSNPSRQASNQAMTSQVNTARNLSGGNAGNLRANQSQAYAANADRQAAINNQESQRKLGIANQNTESLNRAKLVNLDTNTRADELDLANQAKKSEALARGLSGISSLAANSELMNNQRAADADNLSNLSQMFRNFDIVDGRVQVRKPVQMAKMRKGVKKVI